jgi:ribosomal protein S18 acetylase RimI-like enzyme
VLEVRRIRGTDPDAIRLVGAMTAGLRELYGPVPDPSRVSGEEMAPPHGAFVVLAEDGDVVAGGGVRRLGEGLAEIKRMYVEPAARSRGLARRLLAELEAAARELGYARVRLDTGAEQPHAQALYRSAGYRDIPDYNANRLAVYWAEKALA